MKGAPIASHTSNRRAMTDSAKRERHWNTHKTNNNNNNINYNKSPFYLSVDDDELNFSFYSTDSEKLDAGTSSSSKPLYNAFPSWSPIASGFEFEMTPKRDEDDENENQEKPAPLDEHRCRIPDKPSYSDVLAKSPANFAANKQKCAANLAAPPVNRMSRHSADSFRNKEKSKRNANTHKWFSMEDLVERETASAKGASGGDEGKAKTRGHSSPGLLSDVTGAGAGAGAAKVKAKESVQVKRRDVEVKAKAKFVVGQEDGEVEVEVQPQPQPQLFVVTEGQGLGLGLGRNRKGYHRRSIEKGGKEVSKKQVMRTKRGSDARFYFDYIFLVVASNLSFCADWISHVTHWLVDLVVDVSIMSGNLCWHLFQQFCVHFSILASNLTNWVVEKWRHFVPWVSFTWHSSPKKKKDEDNIPLPATRDEAMRRLLSCKGKDPYSILGVSRTATDEDIKKYYKKQAFLVHPDKNRTIGAEEAFKVLAHAFDIIGDPNKRRDYDSKRQEAQQLEETWNEFADLLSQLQEKMDEVANTIKCTNCKRRHRRIKVDRPRYSARFCRPCKIMHSAREGDIWAETRILGFLWHYYACMDGAVYDVTEWAACQSKNLKHLRANTHTVQYRIISSSKQNSSSFESSPSESNFEDMFKNYQKKTSNLSAKSDFSKKKKNKRK